MAETVSVTVEELSPTERNLKISVEAKHVESALEEALSKVQRRVNIKGFRKGKAPVKIVKNMYAQEIQSEAVYSLLDSTYPEALGKVEFRVVSRPMIQDIEFLEGKPFQYTAKVEILPEIKLKKTKGLEIESMKDEVSATALKREIDYLRNIRAEWVPMTAERGVQKDDLAVIDCEGFSDGKKLPELSGEALSLEVGTGRGFPGFEERVIGVKLNAEKQFELPHPEMPDHPLSGKMIQFTVKVREIKEKKLPECNDEFAKDFGDFASWDAFEKDLRQHMEVQAKERAQQHDYDKLIDALVEANPFPVPQALVEDEMEAMVQQLKETFAERKMPLPDDDDPKWTEIRADYRGRATKRVQGGILLDAVARQEKIELTDEDLEQALQRMSVKARRPVEEIRRYYADARMAESLQFKVKEEKTLEFLRENAKIIKRIDAPTTDENNQE